MQAPRTALPSALAIVLIAGVLAACGVKSDLERPSAERPSTGVAETHPARSERKVFYENSRVVGVSRNLEKDMMPPMPPKKWEKKDPEPERSPRALAPRSHERQPDPDKAFFLDWML